MGDGIRVRSTQTAHLRAEDLSHTQTLLSKKKNPRSQGNEGSDVMFGVIRVRRAAWQH
jgi:hypothetical protein